MITKLRNIVGRPRYEPRRPLPKSSRPVLADVNSARSTVKAMLYHLGLSPTELTNEVSIKNSIVTNCRRCRRRADCRLWLADRSTMGKTPGFCMNATHFGKLAAQRSQYSQE